LPGPFFSAWIAARTAHPESTSAILILPAVVLFAAKPLL